MPFYNNDVLLTNTAESLNRLYTLHKALNQSIDVELNQIYIKFNIIIDYVFHGNLNNFILAIIESAEMLKTKLDNSSKLYSKLGTVPSSFKKNLENRNQVKITSQTLDIILGAMGLTGDDCDSFIKSSLTEKQNVERFSTIIISIAKNFSKIPLNPRTLEQIEKYEENTIINHINKKMGNQFEANEPIPQQPATPRLIQEGYTIKLGIIGVGNSMISQLEAIRFSNDILPKFRIIALCDNNRYSNEDKRIGDQKRYSYPDSTTRINCLANLDTVHFPLDAIVVATDLKSHYKNAINVINNGISLLLEKPAVSNLEQLKTLIKSSRDNKIPFICSFHASFDNTINWLLQDENKKEYLSDNIKKIKCEFFDYYSFNGERPPEDHIFDSLVDSWLDSGINALSVISKIINDSYSFLKYESSESEFQTLGQFFLNADTRYIHRIVDTKVIYSVNNEFNEKITQVEILTSWMKKLDSKITTIEMEKGVEIILNHTEQTVTINNSLTGKTILREQVGERKDRLKNHYVNVYNDFYTHIQKKTDNLDMSLKLHELLFEPVKNQLGYKLFNAAEKM